MIIPKLKPHAQASALSPRPQAGGGGSIGLLIIDEALFFQQHFVLRMTAQPAESSVVVRQVVELDASFDAFRPALHPTSTQKPSHYAQVRAALLASRAKVAAAAAQFQVRTAT